MQMKEKRTERLQLTMPAKRVAFIEKVVAEGWYASASAAMVKAEELLEEYHKKKEIKA